MEIHPPERPIHSVKDFLLQLMTITIGILIALSLEGGLQWWHHLALVGEAKAKMTEEARHNRGEVDDFLNKLPAMKAAQERVLRLIDDLLASKSLHGSVDLHSSYVVMALSSTAWNTAQAAGAVSYMEYTDVERYARVYTLQDRVEQLQNRVLDGYIAGYAPVGDPDKESRSDLVQWRQNVIGVTRYLDAEVQMVQALRKEYDALLGGP